MPNTPFVQPIDNKLRLRKNTVDTPWGKVYADGKDGAFIEPKYLQTPFRCPKCNRLMEPGFFADGACFCGYRWTAKQGIDMLIEAESIKVSQGGWSKAQMDILEDKRKLKESTMLTKDMTPEQMTTARRNISEWYNRKRNQLMAEFDRRATANAVINTLRQDSANAGVM